jgi:hypothetical protein
VSKRCSASVAHATARAVSFARGPANGCFSVNVVLRQSGSGQRPDTLGREQPHRPAETENVMQPDLPAPVAHCNDATARTTGKIVTGLDVQNQA